MDRHSRARNPSDPLATATGETVSQEEKLRQALREIANRAGAPTMGYSPPNELREQRESLDWIAARAAEALGVTPVQPEHHRLSIDFNAVNKCSFCSERYGFCEKHQDMYGIDYKGDPQRKS